jgi:hypothetical protein
LRNENALSSFVGLEERRVFNLDGLSSFLGDLEVHDRKLASRTASTDETDGRVTNLNLSRDIKGLDLSSEFLAVTEGVISLVDHNISSTGHVTLVKTLDVKTNVVSRLSFRDLLVVHFDGENLTSAGGTLSVGWEEDDFLTSLNLSLFDTSGNDISDTLDLVNTRYRHSHGGSQITARGSADIVKGIKESINVEFLTMKLDVASVPPAHVGSLVDEVITHPSRKRNDGDRFVDEVSLPSNSLKHVLHFVTDFRETFLRVLGNIAIHLVDTNEKLLDTKKVKKTSVLSGLSLDLSLLVVTLLDSGGEVTIGRNEEKSDISLGSSGNHVLDEISVTRGINDGVVPLLSEEFLGGARDGDTSFTFFLLSIHVESESEGRLTEDFSFVLKFLHFSLGDTTKFEQKTTSGGGLAGIDVSANDDRHVFFTLRHGC